MKPKSQRPTKKGRQPSQMALGALAARIIGDLQASGKLLESWMANHLAELLLANKSTLSDDEIRKLILTLWDRGLSERIVEVLKSVQQEIASAKNLSPETLARLSRLVRSPRKAMRLKTVARLNCLSELQDLETQLLYLWLLLERLEEKIESADRPSIILLLNSESVLANRIKQLKEFEPRFHGINPENTDEIRRVTLENWSRIIECRRVILHAIEDSRKPQQNGQKSNPRTDVVRKKR